MNMFNDQAILIAHSLECDFIALKLCLWLWLLVACEIKLK